MNTDKRIAIALGVLLVAGILFGILSSVPALESPDYLVRLPTIDSQILFAVLFQAAMAAVYACVAALLYPVIKKRHNETIAFAYFAFRIIGATFLFVGIVMLLLLLIISRGFADAGRPDPSYFQTIGGLLRAGRDWLNHIGVILPWSLGGYFLYYSFLRTKTVPAWLSIWGIIGTSSTVVATLLFMLDRVPLISFTYFALNVPTALLEVVLAIFLMLKGFAPSVTNTEPTSSRISPV